MIFTGDVPVSSAARHVLSGAAERAAMQRSSFASCDDLLDSLIACGEGEVAAVWAAVGWPPRSVGAGAARAAVANAHDSDASVDPSSIRANTPLQRAIELSADGSAITTGSLLLGLLRAQHVPAVTLLSGFGLKEVEVIRVLVACEREEVKT